MVYFSTPGPEYTNPRAYSRVYDIELSRICVTCSVMDPREAILCQHLQTGQNKS